MITAPVEFADPYSHLGVHRSQQIVRQMPVANPAQRTIKEQVRVCNLTFRSYVEIPRGGKHCHYFGPGGKTSSLRAPSACRFASDAQGVKIELRANPAVCYCLTAEDLLTKTGFELARLAIAEFRKCRQSS